jgi:hypothetical protein
VAAGKLEPEMVPGSLEFLWTKIRLRIGQYASERLADRRKNETADSITI